MAELTKDQKAKILEIISEHTYVPIDGIQEHTILKEELCIDSLDIVELIMKIEEEFECNIPDEDYEHVKTVNDIFKVAQNRIN